MRNVEEITSIVARFFINKRDPNLYSNFEKLFRKHDLDPTKSAIFLERIYDVVDIEPSSKLKSEKDKKSIAVGKKIIDATVVLQDFLLPLSGDFEFQQVGNEFLIEAKSFRDNNVQSVISIDVLIKMLDRIKIMKTSNIYGNNPYETEECTDRLHRYSGRTNLRSKELSDRIIKYWFIELNKKVTVNNHPSTGKPDSRLLKFIVDVAKALLGHPISEHTLAEWIKKSPYYRKSNKR